MQKYNIELNDEEIGKLNKIYKIEISKELEIETAPKIKFPDPQQLNIELKFVNTTFNNEMYQLLELDKTGIFVFAFEGIIKFENVHYKSKFEIKQNSSILEENLSATVRTFEITEQ